MMLQVRDLPARKLAKETRFPGGERAYIEQPNPILYCPCGAEYSANPFDYWAVNPDTILRCQCGEPMQLVYKRTTYEPYDKEAS